MTAAELGAAIEETVERFVASAEQNLGHLETQLAAQALLRQAAETGAQKKADATPPRCPQCQRALTWLAPGCHAASQRLGEVTVRGARGYCPRCRKWRAPAYGVLGQAETNGYSPAVQEMTALVATKMPVGEASLVLERITGIKVPRATLEREARRQGERAVQPAPRPRCATHRAAVAPARVGVGAVSTDPANRRLEHPRTRPLGRDGHAAQPRGLSAGIGFTPGRASGSTTARRPRAAGR